MGRKLATNTTVEGTTYPAGTEVPAEVEALIDNPNAWNADKVVDAEGGTYSEPLAEVVDAGSPFGAADDADADEADDVEFDDDDDE